MAASQFQTNIERKEDLLSGVEYLKITWVLLVESS